ncbi:MAG: glutamate--tRNA ligase family protein [Clostridia bacterium]
MSKKLAELLFPNVKTTLEDLEKKFPQRNLPQTAVVTRFAPSPTGKDLHLGHLFNCLVASRIAKASNGVYFLRIEDTDKKREIAGSVEAILKTLKHYGISFTEGRSFGGKDFGNYGPYLQSERAEIYQTVAKHLVEIDKAYPCFCSEEEIENIRIKQTELKCPNLGYYGEYAKCSSLTYEEIEEKIKRGEKFVLRFRSPAKAGDRITYHDAIKGEITLDANINDAVILKSDGIPPYNFAHVCDDHFMRTNLVIRGEEYSGTPTSEHIQIFNACGYQVPQYAHNPHIQKLDNGKRRKISKSKDPEASVSFYTRDGYPVQAVVEYLLNLANSNFESWRNANPNEDNREFQIDINKLSNSGSLFDLMKLNDVSKTIIASFTAEKIYELTNEWAKVFAPEFSALLEKNKEYSIKMFSIDRGNVKPRKDIAKWNDVPVLYDYFFDEKFFDIKAFDFGNFEKEDITKILNNYASIYDENDSKDEWFSKIKSICPEYGFSSDVKEFKANPTLFKGHVGDISSFIRVALTGRKNTPDLYEIARLLKKENLKTRIEHALSVLNK